MTLLAVDDAQARLLASVTPLPAETVALADAAGRYLAADCVALRTQPPFAAAAMDGYAIRWVDRAGPWQVIGTAAAGRGFAGTVGAGQAVRILTGAPLPAGSDALVIQEDIARDGDMLRLTGDGPPAAGLHIRRAGLDFAAGDVLGRAGERLGAARLGLLAAGGHGTVPVHARPVVALLATGDELVPPGVMPGPDQIVSANGAMLGAMFTAAGARVLDGGIVADDRAALATAIRALAHADLLVTIGGASVGDHDLVLPVLQELGAEIDFWKVAVRPGKPMLAGRLGAMPVIGLPGNPVSAYVCALLFVVPMLRRLTGDPAPLPMTVTARLGAALAANGARRDHLRATLADGVVTPAATQDSSMLRVLATADALIVRLPGAPVAEAGEIVDCLLLDTVPPVA